MAERHRSKDGRSETRDILGGRPEKLDETAQEGAKGGAHQESRKFSEGITNQAADDDCKQHS